MAGRQSIVEVELPSLADAFAKVVQVEGPIATEVAKHRVAEAWQTRRSTRIDSHFDKAIRLAELQKKLVIRPGFLWPLGMTTAPLRIPTNGKDARPIREIPPEETAIAVQECVNSAVGIEREDLIREVCKLFGLKATDDNSFVIDGVIDKLVSNQMLISRNGKILRGKVF